jgi:hypothetical protein
MFEPADGTFWEAVRQTDPELLKSIKPWNKIVEPEPLRALLIECGVTNPEVVAEPGTHPLNSPEDWWMIVLGSGYRSTVETLAPSPQERVRVATIEAVRRQKDSRNSRRCCVRNSAAMDSERRIVPLGTNRQPWERADIDRTVGQRDSWRKFRFQRGVDPNPIGQQEESVSNQLLGIIRFQPTIHRVVTEPREDAASVGGHPPQYSWICSARSRTKRLKRTANLSCPVLASS